MLRHFFSFLVVCVLVGQWPCYAAENSFQHVSNKRTLNYNPVKKIVQDNQGYLWISTCEGIFRYDGYSFMPFLADDNFYSTYSTTDLVHDEITNSLWIANSVSGLTRIECSTQKVTRFRNDSKQTNSLQNDHVRDICMDRYGNIWISTLAGLDRLTLRKNPNTGKEEFLFKHFINTSQPGFNTKSGRIISCLTTSAEGQIWCGTEKGITVLDPASGSTVAIDHGDGCPENVHCILEDHHGNFWIGSAEGLLVCRKNDDNIIFNPLPVSSEMLSKNISTIFEDRSGNVWVGSTNLGVCQFNKITHEVTNMVHDPRVNSSIVSNTIHTIFQDNTGLIWIGTDNGMEKLNLNSPFSNFDLTGQPVNFESGTFYVFSILKDDDNNLWMSSHDQGIIKFNLNTRAWKAFSTKEKGDGYIPDNDVECLVKYHNKIIGASKKGLLVIDPSTNKIELLANDANRNKTSLLYEDAHGRLWASGTHCGLLLVNLENHVLEPVQNSFQNKNEFATCTIQSIMEDSDGNFWVGTNDGLKLFNRETNKVTAAFINNIENEKSICSNDISALYEDYTGNIWIGTYGGGLDRYEKASGSFTHFTENLRAGKFDIYSLTGDEKGNLWMSTNDGIIKFNPQKKLTQYFDHTDGMMNNEFNSNAFWKDNDGRFYFGTVNGVSSFYPDSVASPYFQSNVVFNRVTTNTSEIPIDYSDLGNPTVTLNPHDYTFSIDFSAINFVFPNKTTYAYMLEGFDKEWISTGNRHFTVFTNIPPGTYSLKVKALNQDSRLPEQIRTLTIIIPAPFWKTNWFYTLTVLGLIGISLLVIYFRFKILHDRKKLELSEKMNKHKQQFLANMSHEIRTPMNAVVGFTDLLSKSNLSKEQFEYTNAIKSSATNLLVIINDILDYSKIEAGKIELEKHPFRLDKTVEELRNMFIIKAKEKNISLVANVDENVPQTIIGDKVRITQILANLIGNAIKFTPKGVVSVRIKLLAKNEKTVTLELSVKDTGIGIPSEKLTAIFDSFSQVSSSNTRLYGGTGLGLTITKQLVELHNGTIYVDSQLNEGSTFTVRFETSYIDRRITEPLESDSASGTDRIIYQDLNFLIVEDNHFNQTLLKTILKKHFPLANLDIAANGKEAIALYDTHSYDVVLMDVHMPEMDGYQTTFYIRNNYPSPKNRVPIIACTAGVTTIEVEDCYKSGMDDYISKPFRREEMILKICNQIENLSDYKI